MTIGLVQPGTSRGMLRDDDRLAEDDAAEDVADRAVRGPPHLLQAELLDPRLVRGDRGALDADAVLLGGVGGVDGDLVVGGVAVLDAEVVVRRGRRRGTGRISCSLMNCQMIRVISSPSISTIVPCTLILLTPRRSFVSPTSTRRGLWPRLVGPGDGRCLGSEVLRRRPAWRVRLRPPRAARPARSRSRSPSTTSRTPPRADLGLDARGRRPRCRTRRRPRRRRA